ncbi:MAG: methionyl aminopeptidase [Verrucomicrobiales bacterium]|jgi:methionyl aminopeptidase
MAVPIRKGKQLDYMRTAGGIARDILLKAAAMVKPGVTTGEIDAYVAELIKERDCISAFLGYRSGGGPRFPGHICISVNEEIVHGIGSERKIQFGDILKIDVGIVKDGWVGDNALTVPAGEIEPETYRLLYATEESLDEAIRNCRKGVMLGDMCASIEAKAREFGYSVVKEFVGHGVGKNLHEEPQVPNYRPKMNKPRLQPGMILAIEPMVNLGLPGVKVLDDDWTVITKDGKPSAHYEHTVLITDGEPEILTARDRLTSAAELKRLCPDSAS